MKGYEIRQIMKDRGISVSGIAKKVGVTSPSVSQVIHGKIRSHRISKAIAEDTGKEISDLWPDQEQA